MRPAVVTEAISCYGEDQIRDNGQRIRFVPNVKRRKPLRAARSLSEAIGDKLPNYCSRETAHVSEVLNPWVADGPIGTRDAVLVFRTSALNHATLATNWATNSSSGSNSSVSSNNGPSNELLDGSSSPSSSDGFLHEMIAEETETIVHKLPAIVPTKSGSLRHIRTEKKKSSHAIRTVLVSSTSEPAIAFREDINEKRRIGGGESGIKKAVSAESDGFGKLATQGKLSSIRSEMPGAILNIRYRFINTESRLLRKIFISHGVKDSEDDHLFNVLWTGIHLKPDILRNLLPYQRVNHFPRSYELTRKDRLYKNIIKMQHLRGFKNFDIVPESYLLPLEYKDFVVAHNKYRGPWIVKPVASSRGRGIFIIHSPDQVPSDEQLLVAKYIANPLCIDGHKCDVRLYVAVTSFDPLIIYLYEEGLVRLATVKYNPSTEYLWNSCMHLCNYSINKYHSDYIKSMNADVEDVGHKWTLSALLRHLRSQGCDTDQLMLSIEDLVIKAIFSSTQSVASACRMFVPNINNCFELFGFDILIDDALKPWLLEVNLSPSLSADSPLDVKVKASLLTDLLNLVGVPAISPLMKAAYDSKCIKTKGVVYNTSTNYGSQKRRVVSADLMQNPAKKALSLLSSEETKIVKSAKSQHERRGGFVRIFPTVNSILKYGAFLDPATGIPTSTPPPAGSQACSMIIPRNYNQMLHSQLFGQEHISTETGITERISKYERTLEFDHPIANGGADGKFHGQKSADEARRLRKQISRLIENGSEMSQLQARKTFQTYLEFILRRLSVEPKLCHEKLILKFLQRSGISFKLPQFIKNPLNHKIASKDRSALILKMLSDYIENYLRDTETMQEQMAAANRFGHVPQKMFMEFISSASEHDLELILTIHTNATQHLPFLHDRCTATNVPQPRPIPVGGDEFLKALPNMAQRGPTKDSVRIDDYYKRLAATGGPKK